MAYSNRGNAYSNKGDLDRATDYDQAIRLNRGRLACDNRIGPYERAISIALSVRGGD
jgi:hypothetical protein